MNNTQCNHLNGTYACKLASGHTGVHQQTTYKRNSANKIVFYVTSAWATAYGEVKHKKGFA